MWVTSKGTRLGSGNVRRMLREVVRRTNERRAKKGKMLIPAITPHDLRRTFACLCFWAKRELPWVMDQIGHEDSRMTVEVYARASKRKRVDRGLVWRLMRFPDEPRRSPGSSRN
jgi:integrase